MSGQDRPAVVFVFLRLAIRNVSYVPRQGGPGGLLYDLVRGKERRIYVLDWGGGRKVLITGSNTAQVADTRLKCLEGRIMLQMCLQTCFRPS